MKRDCRSKNVDFGKRSDEPFSSETNKSNDEGGDVYFASYSTHSDSKD